MAGERTHFFLIIDKTTNEVVYRDKTTAYGEWVGCLWANIIHLYDSGLYKTQKLIHLHPKPENCKTFTDQEIINFCKLMGAN